MRKRIVKYADITEKLTDTKREAAVMTKVIKAYVRIIGETLVSGLTFSIPAFGKFHIVTEARRSYNVNKNMKLKAGVEIIAPSDRINSNYHYLPAVEFQKDNALHNGNYYLNLVPKLWQPILSLIQENKLFPPEHGYQQESINS